MSLCISGKNCVWYFHLCSVSKYSWAIFVYNLVHIIFLVSSNISITFPSWCCFTVRQTGCEEQQQQTQFKIFEKRMLIKSLNFTAIARTLVYNIGNIGILSDLMRHGSWLCWGLGWKLNECVPVCMKLNWLPIVLEVICRLYWLLSRLWQSRFLKPIFFTRQRLKTYPSHSNFHIEPIPCLWTGGNFMYQ